MKKTKRFNGKVYLRLGFKPMLKFEAQRTAEKFRARGSSARIVKTNRGYFVYTIGK